MYNVIEANGKAFSFEPVTLKEAKAIVARAKHQGIKLTAVKVAAPVVAHHNGIALIFCEMGTNGWADISYSTGGYTRVPAREIEYR